MINSETKFKKKFNVHLKQVLGRAINLEMYLVTKDQEF